MPPIIIREFAMYPRELLAADLKRICLARELYFYGQPFGGTNDSSSVYLASEGEAEGFDDTYLAETFHHEFSSILMRNHAFSAEKWKAANPEGFEYTSVEDGGVKAIRNAQDGLDGSPEFYEQGLLSEYAKSELEEDFNTFAEALFTGDRRFWKTVDRFPRVEQKARVILAFYAALDPGFTEEHFRSLAQ